MIWDSGQGLFNQEPVFLTTLCSEDKGSDRVVTGTIIYMFVCLDPGWGWGPPQSCPPIFFSLKAGLPNELLAPLSMSSFRLHYPDSLANWLLVRFSQGRHWQQDVSCILSLAESQCFRRGPSGPSCPQAASPPPHGESHRGPWLWCLFLVCLALMVAVASFWV